MNKNNPENPPNIQMTPVEFSPRQTGEDIGSITAAPRAPLQYPVFVPVLIIVLTLIFSTTRDIVTLNKQMTAINQEDAPAQETLKKSGKETEFIESLRADLFKLAATDPVAAQIAAEYFPPPPPAPKEGSPANAPKTPAK